MENTTPYYINVCNCKNFVQDLIRWSNDLLIIEDARTQRTVFEQFLQEYLKNNVPTLLPNDDSDEKKPCSLKICSILLQKSEECKRFGMTVSSLLLNLITSIHLKKCSNLCCCLLLNLEEGVCFRKYNNENEARIISAFHKKPDYMKLLVKFGLVTSLPERSSFMIAETKYYLHRFM